MNSQLEEQFELFMAEAFPDVDCDDCKDRLRKAFCAGAFTMATIIADGEAVVDPRNN